MKVFTNTLAGVALAVAAGCGAPPAGRAPAAAAPPVPLAVGVAERGPVTEALEAGGILRARTTAVVASRVMATAIAVHVSPGDRVARGARLVTLDARELDANSARASATVTAATEAQRAAEAQVAAADAALRLAVATHDRIRTLFDVRSATAQEMDQAVANLRQVEAQQTAARAQAASAVAAREAAGAGAEATRVASTYATLTAPFDAVVAARSVDPGTLVMPGAALLILEDPRSLRLEVAMDEARGAYVSRGAAAEVSFDDRPGEWRLATVAEVGRVEPTSHTFLAKLDVPASPTLRSGLFGRARFAGPARDATTVPASSVARRGQLSFVFVVDGTSTARLRSVSAGPTAHGRTEILSGVQPGERVVLAPPPDLRDGAAVSSRGETGAGQ